MGPSHCRAFLHQNAHRMNCGHFRGLFVSRFLLVLNFRTHPGTFRFRRWFSACEKEAGSAMGGLNIPKHPVLEDQLYIGMYGSIWNTHAYICLSTKITLCMCVNIYVYIHKNIYTHSLIHSIQHSSCENFRIVSSTMLPEDAIQNMEAMAQL